MIGGSNNSLILQNFTNRARLLRFLILPVKELVSENNFDKILKNTLRFVTFPLLFYYY